MARVHHKSRKPKRQRSPDDPAEIVLPLHRVFARTGKCKFNVSYKHLMRLSLIHKLSWKLRLEIKLSPTNFEAASSVANLMGTRQMFMRQLLFFCRNNVVKMRLMFNIRE